MKTQSQIIRSVPVLITWDVDPDLWMPFDRRQRALHTARDACQQHGIRATFFITAQPAHEYAGDFEEMQAQGHEIGCHGLTHGDEEDYDQMPEEMQRRYIGQATEKLQSVIGAPIRAFRSPRVKTSAQTLELLAEHGYWADSSVCSQRMDMVSSNLLNIGWIFAPRRAYRPHQSSAFKCGDVPIWEIPVSAVVAPFISSMLAVTGLAAMKMLFRLLYIESQHTGKPIVYLAHPIEFAPMGKGHWQKTIRREYFTLSYIRTHGLRLRNLLSRTDRQTLLNQTLELFAYMASFPDVAFMTASEYTMSFLEKTSRPILATANTPFTPAS
jgi:hypothetical protein